MSSLEAETPKPSPRFRVAAFVVLAIAVVAAFIWFNYGGGKHIVPHDRERFRTWVSRHPQTAPLIYIGAYIFLVLVGVSPVWPLQILAGYGFGIAMAVIWSQIGATIGSVGGLLISRFVAADWFRRRVESRLKKLQSIDEKLGHNGLLVVMAVRLLHFIPIGISNYVFGLTTISPRDVAIGTFIGGIPSVLIYAGVGAGYFQKVDGHRDWRFIAILFAINVVLLVPLAIRYWKPQWFKRFGID